MEEENNKTKISGFDYPQSEPPHSSHTNPIPFNNMHIKFNGMNLLMEKFTPSLANGVENGDRK